MRRELHNLNSAVEAVFANKFRSILTALGIIFGVAAVIAMMAIGNGARQEILEQIKMVGVNNIVITPRATDEEENTSEEENNNEQSGRKNFSPGLTLKDAESIMAVIPGIELISPEVVFNAPVVKSGTLGTAKFSGITPAFFTVFSLELQQGQMFSDNHVEQGRPVCIIGPEIRAKYFKQENPIGGYIKVGDVWLEVIGVLKQRNVSRSATENFGVSEFNNTVFVPVKTILMRYKDRSLITNATLRRGANNPNRSRNYNQLDKIIVQLSESEKLAETATVIQRLLIRRHAGQQDVEIKVPELLLKQQQRTKDIFNIVLGAIASISLIVGGIGIMNIMLASVMERIREIGVRMAMGARRTDIVFQFVAEATLISISGGFIGVILGIILAKIIMEISGILTIVSLMSILISFGVSATVGIVFGFMPARQAAQQDPVTSLRHD